MEIIFYIIGCVSLIGLLSGILMFWSLQYPDVNQTVADIPLVSIIIPARNEALRIPHLLKTLQEQNWKHFEVIIVDDGSIDDTASVAKSYGALVLQSEQVGDMTMGKANACAYGAKHANGKWLLFLDADVQFVGKDSLEKILSSFQSQNEKGILSLQPYHEINKGYENLSAVFNIIVLTGINIFTFWKKKFRTAGSFGPVILCDKESYQATGGHAAAEESIMDDFAISDLFIKRHLPVTNYGGKGIIQMRMYEEGPKQLIEGWTKNLATASQSTNKFVMLLINLWILGAIITPGAVLIGLFFGFNSMYFLLSLVLYFFYGIHVYVLARRAGRFSFIVGIFYPMYILFFTFIYIYSLYRTHIKRSVMWRGREIKV